MYRLQNQNESKIRRFDWTKQQNTQEKKQMGKHKIEHLKHRNGSLWWTKNFEPT